MRHNDRSLRFNVMRTGSPITAVRIVGSPAKSADEAILNIKAEFKTHDCKKAFTPKGNRAFAVALLRYFFHCSPNTYAMPC